jgi:uncharacterized protein with HEPN domain
MKRDKAYLQDILDATFDIEKFMRGVTKKEFFKNKEKQYAVYKALEIIGEATKSVSKELRAKHGQIPWKEIAGMRDKLIHDYLGISIERVWETVKKALPPLKQQISNILKGVCETDKDERK